MDRTWRKQYKSARTHYLALWFQQTALYEMSKQRVPRSRRPTLRLVLLSALLALAFLHYGTLLVRGYGAASRVLLAPVLERGGPSNQVFQAKEVMYALKECSSAVELVLPPLLPHYLQRKVDRPTDFSVHFELEPGRLLDERDLASRALGDARSWPAESCPVYYSPGKYNTKRWASSKAAGNAAADPARERCRTFAELFQKRTAGRVCRSLTYEVFEGSLCQLAAAMRRRHKFALACDLEHALSRQAWFDRRFMPQQAEYDFWIGTAAAMRVRHKAPLGRPTLTLQLRVPDYVLVTDHKSVKHDPVDPSYACLCVFRDCLHCSTAHHVYTPRQSLVAFIAREVRSSPLMHGVEAVHVMTNDPALADLVKHALTAGGLAVTVSSGQSLEALMQDYDIAVQSDVFWTTVSSSISTNIVHARLAEGRPLNSIVLWEKIWDTTTQSRAVDTDGTAGDSGTFKLPTLLSLEGQ